VTAEPIKTMSRKFDQALKAANILPIFTMQGYIGTFRENLSTFLKFFRDSASFLRVLADRA
jgi:hypothetical protein